jgi:UDP-GlcNAc3NAcA epimerase
MKLLSVVGARPQFVKIAPIAQAIARRVLGVDVDHRIVHTGQHYDAKLSDVFFSELELPKATVNLGVGSGSHGSQTGAMLAQLESTLLDLKPDIVLVYGDTNSTLAAALAASKLHIPLAHIEAGLRSFNRRMPEEINRVVADHICDLLLAPTPTAMSHLKSEGLGARAVFTGDVMYDAILHFRVLAKQKSAILSQLALSSQHYGVATLHRAENTDNAQQLRRLLSTLNDIAAREVPLVFPIHPRTMRLIKDKLPDWQPHSRLRIVEPLGYLDMIALTDNAAVTLTDSGGLQKEAFFLGCPCITLREETEWEETLAQGANRLTGSDPMRIQEAFAAVRRQFPSGKSDFSASILAAFGDGTAAEKICQALAKISLEKTKKDVRARTNSATASQLAIE